MHLKQFALKTLTVGLTVALAVALMGALAAAPTAHAADPLPGWQQVNPGGFGDPPGDEVSALAVFNNVLYAATHNPIDPELLFDGAQIFRAPDGATWTAVTDPGFGNSHDIAPPAILDMAVFGGRLYASTGRGDGPAQIWRTLNGTTWAPVVIAGFNNPDTVDITVLAEFNNMLYAAATNSVDGVQIWRSYTGGGSSSEWTQSVTPPSPGPEGARVTGMAVFDGALYAAIASDAPAQVWVSYGGDWTALVDDGFGQAATSLTGGVAVFGGALYVGAGSTASGAQLWRSGDGAAWEAVGDPGFGAAGSRQVGPLFVFQNQLYAGVENDVTGLALWRSANGTTWVRANTDGFGDAHNTTSPLSHAAAEFGSRLYVGTANRAGGELWRMQPPSQSKAYLSIVRCSVRGSGE